MKSIGRDVEEIDSDEAERILSVAAAIDVAKTSGDALCPPAPPLDRGAPHVAGVGGRVDDELDPSGQ